MLDGTSTTTGGRGGRHSTLLERCSEGGTLGSRFSFLAHRGTRDSSPRALFRNISTILRTGARGTRSPRGMFNGFARTRGCVCALCCFLRSARDSSLSFFFEGGNRPLAFLTSGTLYTINRGRLSLVTRGRFSVCSRGGRRISISGSRVRGLSNRFGTGLRGRRILGDVGACVVGGVSVLSWGEREDSSTTLFHDWLNDSFTCRLFQVLRGNFCTFQFNSVLLQFLVYLNRRLPCCVHRRCTTRSQAYLTVRQCPLFQGVATIYNTGDRAMCQGHGVVLRLFQQATICRAIVRRGKHTGGHAHTMFSILRNVNRVGFLTRETSYVSLAWRMVATRIGGVQHTTRGIGTTLPCALFVIQRRQL